MERLLLKIRELEREAQILIGRELGNDSIPSPVLLPPQHPPKCKDQVQEEQQQQEQRFSPRLSTADNPRTSNITLEEDGNQTPKVQPIQWEMYIIFLNAACWY